jgi:hypothetical protein
LRGDEGFLRSEKKKKRDTEKQKPENVLHVSFIVQLASSVIHALGIGRHLSRSSLTSGVELGQNAKQGELWRRRASAQCGIEKESVRQNKST